MRKLTGWLFVAVIGQAQGASAPVEELSQAPGGQASTSIISTPGLVTDPSVGEPQSSGDFYYQMQVLQQEVRELRGMVEEQNYEIRRLKQRQMDDYQDLDQRVSNVLISNESSNPSPVASGTDGSVGSLPAPLPSAPVVLVNIDEVREHYTAVYGLLKQGEIEESVLGFKEHIALYPNNKYTANAHYWLGEIALNQNQLEDAQKSFSTVVDNYPAHRKVNDAMFKLGKVYHLQGERAKAKVLLEKVALTASSAATLAENYLQKNF